MTAPNVGYDTDYELLENTADVVRYLRASGLAQRLGDEAPGASITTTVDSVPTTIAVREVTAGNMNRVFIATGPLGSVAIKQAPPFVQVAGPSWPIDPNRIAAEARAYELLGSLVPDAVPAIVSVDLDRYIMVMEDLSELSVLRDVLVANNRAVFDEEASAAVPIDFEHLGEVVGRFVGELSYATSIDNLGERAHAELVAESANPELCALTIDVVLDEPYREHEHNHWHSALESSVRALYSDAEVAAAVAAIRTTFDSSNQALLHGDLHSGSVMIGQSDGQTGGRGQKVTVFDPEFSFVGPIGLDLGLFWANLEIHAVAADAIGAPSAAAARSAITASWAAFATAWAGHTTPEWLESVRRDSWRFAGVEAMRRAVGYSHAADVDTLPDSVTAAVNQTIFDRARHWIVSGTQKENP